MKLMTKDERYKLGDKKEKQALKMLKDTHNCLMVCVTGFGKTYHLINIAKKYDKVYYMVPRIVIKNDIISKYDLSNINIEFITYQKMVSIFTKHSEDRYFGSDKKYKKLLFILDEAHCAGSPKASQCILKLKDMFPDAYFIGATATPERSDKFNLAAELFNGNILDRYDTKIAFEEGFYAKPKYIYAIYELKEEFENIKKQTESSDLPQEAKNNIYDEINKYMIQYNMILGIPDIIRNNLDLRKKYFKFFIFFPTHDALFAKHDTVIEWFNEALPGFKINDTIIVSKPPYRDNISDLENMKSISGNVDLIFCCDMLNMGYHVDDVSGIVMMRSTLSDIIYLQQIGRSLSANSNIKPIIFDLVGNYAKAQEYGNYSMISSGKTVTIGEFDQDCMEATDYVTDVSMIMRIWGNVIKDNPKMYADAYDHKNAPIKFAMNGMNCRTIKQFVETLKIYGYELKQKDMHLLSE